jgi:hypothetical protein
MNIKCNIRSGCLNTSLNDYVCLIYIIHEYNSGKMHLGTAGLGCLGQLFGFLS